MGVGGPLAWRALGSWHEMKGERAAKIVLAIIGAGLLLGSVWAFQGFGVAGHDTMPGRDGRAIGIIFLAIFFAGSLWATLRHGR